MADQPDGIVLRRHRDLEGRRYYLWARRALVALLAVVPVLGLLNVFGQRPSTTRVQAVPASFAVTVPSRLRGGLLYQAHFVVDAKQPLREATIVLSQDWLDGMTVNTIEPSPPNEASRNGRLALGLGHLPAGARHELFVQFQVNPTTVGGRTLRAELDDGGQTIAVVTRDLRVFP